MGALTIADCIVVAVVEVHEVQHGRFLCFVEILVIEKRKFGIPNDNSSHDVLADPLANKHRDIPMTQRNPRRCYYRYSRRDDQLLSTLGPTVFG